MSVSDTKDLPRLNAILYDRPAGRNIIGHAIDTIERLRKKVAELEERAPVQEPPKPLRYRHYKGGTYEYITDGHLEWDPEWHVIVYRSEADGTVWVRPRYEFFGVLADGSRRFIKIEEGE